MTVHRGDRYRTPKGKTEWRVVRLYTTGWGGQKFVKLVTEGGRATRHVALSDLEQGYGWIEAEA